MGRVEADEQAPAQEDLIEPGIAGRGNVDQQDDEVDDHENRQVGIEKAQGLDPAPGPLLDLGLARRLADADARRQLDRLAARATRALNGRCRLLSPVRHVAYRRGVRVTKKQGVEAPATPRTRVMLTRPRGAREVAPGKSPFVRLRPLSRPWRTRGASAQGNRLDDVVEPGIDVQVENLDHLRYNILSRRVDGVPQVLLEFAAGQGLLQPIRQQLGGDGGC